MDKVTLEQVIASERENDLLLAKLKEEIVEAVSSMDPIEGVTTIPSTRLSAVCVKMSTIASQPNMPLTAGFYSQKSQAETVRSYLDSAGKSYELVERLNAMLEKKAVKTKNQTVPLNEATLNALRKFV